VLKDDYDLRSATLRVRVSLDKLATLDEREVRVELVLQLEHMLTLVPFQMIGDREHDVP
jgi:hypothetical protein